MWPGNPGPSPRGARAAPGFAALELLDEHGHCAIQDLGQVAAGNGVPQEIACPVEFRLCVGVDGHAQQVAIDG